MVFIINHIATLGNLSTSKQCRIDSDDAFGLNIKFSILLIGNNTISRQSSNAVCHIMNIVSLNRCIILFRNRRRVRVRSYKGKKTKISFRSSG